VVGPHYRRGAAASHAIRGAMDTAVTRDSPRDELGQCRGETTVLSDVEAGRRVTPTRDGNAPRTEWNSLGGR
jgi:hypothetical protein